MTRRKTIFVCALLLCAIGVLASAVVWARQDAEREAQEEARVQLADCHRQNAPQTK